MNSCSLIISLRNQRFFISFVYALKLQSIGKYTGIYLYLRAWNGTEIARFSRSLKDEICFPLSTRQGWIFRMMVPLFSFSKYVWGKDGLLPKKDCGRTAFCLASIWLYIFPRITNASKQDKKLYETKAQGTSLPPSRTCLDASYCSGDQKSSSSLPWFK